MPSGTFFNPFNILASILTILLRTLNLTKDTLHNYVTFKDCTFVFIQNCERAIAHQLFCEILTNEMKIKSKSSYWVLITSCKAVLAERSQQQLLSVTKLKNKQNESRTEIRILDQHLQRSGHMWKIETVQNCSSI